MARTSRLLLLLFVVAVCWTCCCCEIHRAKAINSRPYHPGRSQHRARQGNVSSWMLGLRELGAPWKDTDQHQIWFYSLVSAALVGLSGIFPLLVIPLEVGEALRKGAEANNRLKLLLSFAVGGLLGDVFLHLLPEAWAHLTKLGGPHTGNIEIGCWVLAGLLSFMIIEKLFPEDDSSDEEAESDSETEQDTDTEQTVISPTTNNLRQRPGGQRTGKNGKDGKSGKGGENGKSGESDVDSSGSSSSLHNGHCNGSVNNNNNGQNGAISNGKNSKPSSNGSLRNGFKVVESNGKLVNGGPTTSYSNGQHAPNGFVKHSSSDVLTKPASSVTHIKTSGWLNLVANMIDNFTHGLAVAGSYSVSLKTGLITTFAILLHEVPHEIGDFAILLRSGFDRWKAAKAQLLTATGGILGAVAALSAESAESAGDRTAWILPFTSGGFIYIALVSVLPDLLKDHTNPWQSLKQLTLLCAGIVVMAAITVWVD